MSKKRSSLNPIILIIVGLAVGLVSYFMNRREWVGPYTIFIGVGGLLFLYGLMKRLFTRKPKHQKPDTYHTAHHSHAQHYPQEAQSDLKSKQKSKHIPSTRQHQVLYCPHCGSRLQYHSNFCSSCGGKLR